MPILFVAQSSNFFTNGAFAAVLLCVGLAIGLALGKRQVADSSTDRADVQKLAGVLAHLVNWTHGVADDMSEYRSVVSGVSDLFRNTHNDLNDEQRDAALGLLSQVVEANEQLQNRLNQAEHMLKQQADEISTHMSEARTDSLTRLPNRRAFDEDLNRRLAEWKRYGRPLSILMVDVDHFKKFNDSHGHQTGDQVLHEVAAILRDTMRESDLVARFGGEEYSIILPDTDSDDACIAAERVRAAIGQGLFGGDNRSLKVTVSVGAASCQTDESGARVVQRADEALYAAKQAGRNRAYWHNGSACQSVTKSGEALPVAPDAAGATTPTSEPPAIDLGHDAFAQVCQDLRRRLREVTTAPL